jgi:DNA-binding IclR family transcriptional regulator
MLTRCWRPRNTPTIWLTEGHRLPLARSSPGRVILAARASSPTDPASIREDRATLQSKGFLVSVGRWNENVNACAVPFWPDSSQEPAAFLCGAHEDVLPETQLNSTVGPLLLTRVRELERKLGISELRPL